MNYHQFVDEVQKRGAFASRDEAATAVQATLQTFGERLSPPEAIELVGHLPEEVGTYLLLNLEMKAEAPSATGFFKRVALRAGVNINEAVCHSRAVIEVLQDALCDGKTSSIADPLVCDITPLYANAVMGEGWNRKSERPVHRSTV